MGLFSTGIHNISTERMSPAEQVVFHVVCNCIVVSEFLQDHFRPLTMKSLAEKSNYLKMKCLENLKRF